jgi:hypothetical protein
VRVRYYEGSGTFGHSCYEHAAHAAAIMSQQVGRPVRVQFMRWDEHGWDNYGPAHLADVRAAIDHNGKIAAYEYHGWQHGWICAVARSTDTSAIPAAVVSSLTMVPTPRGRPSRGRFQSDISATARRLHPRLALGQRKPERDQVETAVLSDLVEEAFRGEGVVRFASKKALAIAAAVAPITSSPAPRGFLQALDHDRNHIRRSARPDCSPNRGW